MPSKTVKPTAAQKRDQKKKEAFEMVTEALVADTVAEQNDEPESVQDEQLVDVPPTLSETNAAEIKCCCKKVKALEHKLDIAFEHSQ
jgi:hypothetical protein